MKNWIYSLHRQIRITRTQPLNTRLACLSGRGDRQPEIMWRRGGKLTGEEEDVEETWTIISILSPFQSNQLFGVSPSRAFDIPLVYLHSISQSHALARILAACPPPASTQWHLTSCLVFMRKVQYELNLQNVMVGKNTASAQELAITQISDEKQRCFVLATIQNVTDERKEKQYA